MTGFKDKLKDALSDFVEFDEDASANETTEERQPRARRERSADADSATAVPREITRTDPEMLATLEHAVARSSEPGYEQFRTLYDAMDSVPDEKLRYDVTLKALQASHRLGPQAVLKSIDDRLRLLDDERTKFEAALQSETERSITAANAEVKAVGDEIAAKQAEIKALQARQADLVRAAKSAQADIDRSRASFTAAYSTVQTSLDAERTRIASHLTGGK
jgi:uncharacterized protein YicC (UPF0701 family)